MGCSSSQRGDAPQRLLCDDTLPLPCRRCSCKNDGMTARDYPRTLRPPSASFFLFGIRGVGKSTWARQRFPHAPRIDLLDEGAFQSFVAMWTLANPKRARTSSGLISIARIPLMLEPIVFALAFVSVGVQRVDVEARGAGLGFRALIFPGVVALWSVWLRLWEPGATGDARTIIPAVSRGARQRLDLLGKFFDFFGSLNQ